MINLHLLRLFVATAEHRSFSRAAEALFISQPAVSKGVRELEAQIGAPLLERRGRDPILTEAGRVLLRHGRTVFAAEKLAEEALGALRGLRGGTLRVGASTTVAAYYLPPVLSAFHQLNPEVEIRLRSANTLAIAQALLDRELDVAVVEGPVDQDGIEVREWRKDRLILIAAPSHAIARRRSVKRSDVAKETFIIREQGSGTREVVETTLAAAGVAPSKILEIGGSEAIARMVAAGMGVSIISEAIAASQIALGELRRIDVEGLEVSRALTRLSIPERMVSPAASAFDLLLDRTKWRDSPG